VPEHVVIVGAGIIGATSALALAEQGYKISIVDAAQEIAGGTSAKNGAQLSYSYTEPLAAPATLKALPKLMAGLDSAFKLSYELSQDFFNWGKLFLQNCTNDRLGSNTKAITMIALKSFGQMQNWLEKYDFDFAYRKVGKLYLYENVKGLKAAKHKIKLKNSLGIKQKILNKDETLAIEPALAMFNPGLAGAVYAPEDAVGDAAKFAKHAIAKAGDLSELKLYLNTKVTSFVKDSTNHFKLNTNKGMLDADKIVIAAGFSSLSLARELGVQLPIMPVAGYSLTYPAGVSMLNVSITDTTKKTVLCRMQDKIRIAGMADMGLVVDEPPKKRIAKLITTVKQRFPEVADFTQDGEPWVGIRPMTPDSRPIISNLKASNVYVNCGHGMLGWTLAAGSALILQEKLNS